MDGIISHREVVRKKMKCFNWNRTSHICAGSWLSSTCAASLHKLCSSDLAFLGHKFQCIACGVKLATRDVKDHFTKNHANIISMPECNLCLAEILLCSKMADMVGYQDLKFVIEDQNQIRCLACSDTVADEYQLLNHLKCAHDMSIILQMTDHCSVVDNLVFPTIADKITSEPSGSNTPISVIYPDSSSITNNGSNKNGKRVHSYLYHYIKKGSEFLKDTGITNDNQHIWTCIMCGYEITSNVPSRDAVLHYDRHHKQLSATLQLELTCVRTERITNGLLRVLHSKVYECLLCEREYVLHSNYGLAHIYKHMRTHHSELSYDSLDPMSKCSLNPGAEICRKRLNVLSGDSITLVNDVSVTCNLCMIVLELSGVFNLLEVLNHLRTKHEQVLIKSRGNRNKLPKNKTPRETSSRARKRPSKDCISQNTEKTPSVAHKNNIPEVTAVAENDLNCLFPETVDRTDPWDLIYTGLAVVRSPSRVARLETVDCSWIAGQSNVASLANDVVDSTSIPAISHEFIPFDNNETYDELNFFVEENQP